MQGMKWRCILLGGPECGGEVDVDTEPKEGATFFVSLQYEDGAARYISTGKCKRDGKVILEWDNGKDKVIA